MNCSRIFLKYHFYQGNLIQVFVDKKNNAFPNFQETTISQHIYTEVSFSTVLFIIRYLLVYFDSALHFLFILNGSFDYK